MNDKVDNLLKDALAPSEKPSAWLNQSILRKAKGDSMMKKPFFNTARVAALAMGVLVTGGSLTTYATWKYLSAEQVADKLGDDKLADSLKRDGLTEINESQTYGNFKATLLGIFSGDNVSNYVMTSDGEVKSDRSYAIVAIEKKDGSAMPDTSDPEYSEMEFLASPFIKGQDPAYMNLYVMNGGCSTVTQDGILYKIINCDNLEAFAKRGVYLGVLNQTFYDNNAYHFDKKSGEITRNEDYDGMNLLFNLPLDESKGSEEAAEAQLEKWQKEAENSDSSVEVDLGDAKDGTSYEIGRQNIGKPDENVSDKDDEGSFESLMNEDWTVKRVKKECVLIKESVKHLTPDKDNYITYQWEYNGSTSKDLLFVDDLFKKNQYGTSSYIDKWATSDSLFFGIYTREKDGTITAKTYRLKDSNK